MRKPLGDYGFAFNLPPRDPYEEQPPVIAFDLRTRESSVQTELGFLTFLALSTTPPGRREVPGVKSRGSARFMLQPVGGGEIATYVNPVREGWAVEGPAGQRYTVVSYDDNQYGQIDVVLEAVEPTPASNLGSGAQVRFVGEDLIDPTYHTQAVDEVGVTTGAIAGGVETITGISPVGSTLVVRDVREDAFAIAGAPAAAYTPLWDRVAVRGPVQVELGLATTCTGYVEDDVPDVVRELAPLWPLRAEAPTRVTPLVVCPADGPVHLGDVPVGTREVSLFLHAPSAGSHVRFGYVPDDAGVAFGQLAGVWQEHTVATIDVPGGFQGFLSVLDRIPVRGPGSLWAEVTTGGEQVTVYGLLTS